MEIDASRKLRLALVGDLAIVSGLSESGKPFFAVEKREASRVLQKKTSLLKLVQHNLSADELQMEFDELLRHAERLNKNESEYLNYLTLLDHDLRGLQVQSVSDRFDKIELIVTDTLGIQHVLTATIDYESKITSLIAPTLPEKFEPKIEFDETSLGVKNLVQLFRAKCDKYASVWSQLKAFDEQAALGFTTSSLVRRINLKDSQCSIEVELKVDSSPAVQVFGPPDQVNKICLDMNKWRSTKSLFDNLESVSGRQISVKRVIASLQEDNACCICYSPLDEAKFECKSCVQPFHLVCIREWCKSNPTTQRSFGTYKSACPHCNAKITVKVT